MNDISPKIKLWTKNFLYVLSGNFFVQMASSAVAFVMSLLVLEISNSIFLYGLYLTIYYSSRTIIPVIFGPFIEKNDKKLIYKACCFAFVLLYALFLFVYKSSFYNVAFIIVLWYNLSFAVVML